MTSAEVAAWLQAIAGVLTFGAAGWAVFAAYQAPKAAARLAEDLRRQGEAGAMAGNIRFNILQTLMRHRGDFTHPEALSALNLIDLAFLEVSEVREAYQQFFIAISGQHTYDFRRERYFAVITAIVRVLGLHVGIRPADIERVYVPENQAKRAMVELAEIEERYSAYFDSRGQPRKTGWPRARERKS